MIKQAVTAMLLATALLLVLAGSAFGYEERALILVDELPGGQASTSQATLENLLGHFDLPYDVKLLDAYNTGDIDSHRVTFYIGSTWDRQLPDSFMEDVMSTDNRVVWINHNVWRLEWSQYEQAFQDKFGFTFIETTSTGDYDQVSFQGRNYTRPQDEFGQTYILDPGKASVIASITDGAGSYPYILRSGNFFYVADDPMYWIAEESDYLVFTDVLHDMVGIDHAVEHKALVRIEDVDPSEDPARIRAIADYLYSQGVPFSLAVIPRFEDPLGAWGPPESLGFSDRPEMVSALEYAVARGGTIVLHGYTHQYGAVANPYNGVTGIDTEFYIQGLDGNGNAVSISPVPGDSVPWVNGRIDSAIAELNGVGLATPLIWETPHYLASDLDNQVFADRFGGVYQRFDDAYFPYVIQRSVYGSMVIPENLGYVDTLEATPAVIIGRADRNLAIRDGYASFFFHSEKDISLLMQTVAGLKALGYTFIDAGSLVTAPPVDMTPPLVTAVTPEGLLTAPPTVITAEYNDAETGVNIASVSLTLDGSVLNGCAVTLTGVSCPVSGIGTGSHIIGGSVADNAGNASIIAGVFQIDNDQPFLFADAFTDGDAAGWAPDSSAVWRVFDYRGNQVYTSNTQELAGSWAGPATLADQVIEADIAFSSQTATTGLAFRGSGDVYSGSYYYFGLYPDEGKWRLYSVNNGDWGNADVPLAEGSVDLHGSTVHRLKASAIGDAIDLFIDGQALTGGHVTNSDHSAGSFGPWLAVGSAYWDNFLVTENGYSFADDYSDGNTEGWELAPSASWSVLNQLGNNVLRAVSPGAIASTWNGPESLRDQVVGADISFTAETATAGITFRGDGRADGSYYYFGLYPDQGKWCLYSVNDGSWGDAENPLAQGTLTLVPGNAYRLEASARGDEIDLYINNLPLPGGHVILTDHRAGGFGVWMALGEAYFDNIVVAQE